MGSFPTSGGSRISPRRGLQLSRGAPTYNFAKFSKTLHEIERIWTPRGGGARPKFYYVDQPLPTHTLLPKWLQLNVLERRGSKSNDSARAWIHFWAPYKVIIRVQQLVLIVLASIGWHHCRTRNAIGPCNWSTVMWPAPICWWRRVSPAIYTTQTQDLGSVL